MDLSEVERTEVGRALGADYAEFGVRPPADAPASVWEGLDAAAKPRARVAPDRFQRKWLQVRLSALRRHRAVADNLTVDHLRRIDQSTCAVTSVQLTHGELLDTDWSVDRLNNDGAYAAGNLAVLSRRANEAKGALGYEEVRRRSRAEEPSGGLTAREWYRLACVMYGACHTRQADAPREWLALATFIPSESTWSEEAMIQQTLLKASATSKSRNEVCRRLLGLNVPAAAHQRLVRAVERLHFIAKGLPNRYDALLDEDIQAAIQSWFHALGSERQKKAVSMLRQMHGGEVLGAEKLDQWSLKTRGYAE